MSYFPFGGSKITLEKKEVVNLKSVNIDKGITTLGFAPRSLVVKPEYNLRPSWLMYPDEKEAKNSSTTFNAFFQVILLK